MTEETRPWGYITKYNPPTCERDYTLCVWDENDQPKTLCESTECQKEDKSEACELACQDKYLSKCFATQAECDAYRQMPVVPPRPSNIFPVLKPVPISSTTTKAVTMPVVETTTNNGDTTSLENLCIFLLMLALVLGAMLFVYLSPR